MDKAGITVSAAHNQMLATAASATAAPAGVISLWDMCSGGAGKKSNEQQQHQDENDVIAAKCETIAKSGFQPLKDVLSMEMW